MDIAQNLLSFLKPELVKEIMDASTIQYIPQGTEILREDQYVKVLPIVIEGLVKVHSRFKEKELLLYYIEPAQSCVESFHAALNNKPSRVFAHTEEDTKVMLIPARYLSSWLRDYPEFNSLFFDQYNLRYSELLDTISHLLVDKMDKRIYNHLKKKFELSNSTSLKLSHGQIANELGTAREVVSRIIKKLENDGLIEQNSGYIKITTTL
ncbi:MAG: Crp/Fnr family transcriptional regulator [Winogradskyella sp.]|uniref:Crp/Fnr family transcriptional regulator n=1 Tax=Winogradskyella sp. TaxID=1883156 RepID=UPI0025D0C7FD|nr:Crp/Fnr family transcriptional regulator [Winogradskyella sp.]NRB58787.1 Crp/Fnr family transcriptional regulator [Winogradskyella sp.]